MAIKIKPQDKARFVKIETEVHPSVLDDLDAYCEMLDDSARNYVLREIVTGFIQDNRKEIDEWKARKNGKDGKDDSAIPIVDKSHSPALPRRGKKNGILEAADELAAINADLEKTDRLHTDTRKNPIGGAVLASNT